MKRILLFILFAFNIEGAFAQNLDLSPFYEKNEKSILLIETQSAKGTGVILSEDGTFVLPFHIISNADYINIKTKDGKTYKADGYRYLSPYDDVAILTIKNVKPKRNSKTKNLAFMPAKIDKTTDLETFDTKILSHTKDKKNLNLKNLSWSEFVSETLNEQRLEEFVSYAEKNENFSMLYKYLKQYAIRGDIPSYRYALLGTLAISGFLDGKDKNACFLNYAKKWFALSVLSAKNVEAASYGLLLTSILTSDKDNLQYIYSYLRKYPATVRKSAKQLDNIMKCDNEDKKCVRLELFNMCRYLQELTSRGY